MKKNISSFLDKLAFSWWGMTINSLCFVFMVMVFGKSCAEDHRVTREREVKQIIDAYKKSETKQP